MRRSLLILAVVSLLALAPAAWAKDFKSNTCAEGGFMYLFGFDDRADYIRIMPTETYGGTLFQVFDFPWARNMIGELNYLYADARGEAFGWQGGDSNLFDLRLHHSAFNVGYFFEGRRLHPYFSGGFGVAALIYEDRAGDRIDEQDLTINLGGGTDYTIWETGQAALERLDLGFRVRYYYIFQKEVFNTALNGVSLTLRLNLRW